MFKRFPNMLIDVDSWSEDFYERTELGLGVDMNMAFMENMSSVNWINPLFQECADLVRCSGNVTSTLLEERTVPCYTFEELLKMHRASGCEVLVIDAEGWDCAIIRSMIEACEEKKTRWPHLIHFEACGHANKKEYSNVEEDTIVSLQKIGYLLLYARNDSTLARKQSMDELPRFATWVNEYFMLSCYVCGWQLWPSNPQFLQKGGRGYEQWLGAPGKDSWHTPQGKWTCEWCIRASTQP